MQNNLNLVFNNLMFWRLDISMKSDYYLISLELSVSLMYLMFFFISKGNFWGRYPMQTKDNFLKKKHTDSDESLQGMEEGIWWDTSTYLAGWGILQDEVHTS